MRVPWPKGQGQVHSSTLRSSISLVLLIVVASAVVAISANGLRLLLPPADLEGPWVWGVRIVGVSAALVGVAMLIAQRRRSRLEGDRGPDPTLGALRTAATIMVMLTLVALLVRPPMGAEDAVRPGSRSAAGETRSGGEPSGEPGGDSGPQSSFMDGSGGKRGSGAGEGGGGSGRSGSAGAGAQPLQSFSQWLTGHLPLVVLLVVAGISFLVVTRRVRRRRLAMQPDFPLTQEDAEAVLEASLDEVAGEGGDPRQQVTAAYHRLLSALAEASFPRQVQEAPHEHLFRALGPLGVHPEPLHQLTRLYVMAQFSQRYVTERHRAAAVHALQASLASLRIMRNSPGAEGLHRVPAEAHA